MYVFYFECFFCLKFVQMTDLGRERKEIRVKVGNTALHGKFVLLHFKICSSSTFKKVSQK